MRPSSLTVLVAQGDADLSSLIASVRSVVATGLAEEVLVTAAASSPDPSTVEDGLLAGSIASARTFVTILEGSLLPAELLRGCSTRFFGILQAGAVVEERGLELQLQAFRVHTDLVMSVAFQNRGEDDVGIRPKSLLASLIASLDSPIVDGRTFGRALVGDGTPIDTISSLVVIRTGAAVGHGLDDADGFVNRRDSNQRDLDGTLLATLTRGTVWCDADSRVTWNGRWLPTTSSTWQRWPTVMDQALELELLDGQSEGVQALISHTRRTAHMLRRPPFSFRDVRCESRADLARGIIDVWKALEATETARPSLMPFHVAIVSDGDPDSVAKSTDSAEKVAVRVSVLGARSIALADGVRSGTLTSEDWFVSGDLARLTEVSELPILFMRAGETIDVIDKLQFAGLLNNGNAIRSFGTIATPSGFQHRLASAGSPLTRPDDEAAVAQIHSLQLGMMGSGDRRDWFPPATPMKKTHRFTTFIVVAPDYTEIHGGVVALHRLCDRLNALGYEAYIHPIGAEGTVRPGWRTPLRRGRALRDAVTIYPEIVSGNPFGSTHVVRWLLNRPGWFTGSPMDEDPNDLLVTFNSQISAEHAVVSVPLIDPSTFFPKDQPGSGGLLWIGKGTLPEDFERFDNMLVTNSWPTKRTDLAALLRGADVLYTCDWLTSLIDEALMCATPVVLVGDQTWTRDEVQMRPGMAWEAEADLDTARQQAYQYYSRYLDSLSSVDASIELFVQLVNDHFGAIDGPPPSLD